jgi:hypothetical protein
MDNAGQTAPVCKQSKVISSVLPPLPIHIIFDTIGCSRCGKPIRAVTRALVHRIIHLNTDISWTRVGLLGANVTNHPIGVAQHASRVRATCRWQCCFAFSAHFDAWLVMSQVRCNFSELFFRYSICHPLDN